MTGARKIVVVAGGGPVGMEAALRLTERGHKAILFERSGCLGGVFRAAAAVYPPNRDYLDWLERSIRASGVDLRLGVQATPESVRSIGPDLVIVATGGAPADSDIPGMDRPNVVLARDLPPDADPAGFGRAAVIVGAGMAGLQTAQWLVGPGRAIAVVDAAPKPGAGLPIVRRARVLHELKDSGVAILSGARLIDIGAHAATCETAGGQVCDLPADHVIMALPDQPDPAVAERFRAAGYRVLTAGDCEGPRFLEETIRDVAALVDGI